MKNTSTYGLMFCVVTVLLYNSTAAFNVSRPPFLSFFLLGLSDREEWLELDGRRVKTVIPGGKALSGQAAEKAPPPVAGPDVGSDTVKDTRRENIPVMPKPPIKVRLARFLFVLVNGIESVNNLV